MIVKDSAEVIKECFETIGVNKTLDDETVVLEKKTENEKIGREKKKAVSDAVNISEEAKRLFLEQLENSKKENPYEDLIKLIEIANRIAKGDTVPPSDEKKLLEAEPDMYLSAKTAATLNANKKHKKHKALFEDEDKNSMKEQIHALKIEAEMSVDTEVAETPETGEGSGLDE